MIIHFIVANWPAVTTAIGTISSVLWYSERARDIAGKCILGPCRWFLGMARLPTTQRQQTLDIKEIKGQVLPNGGSSMRDDVTAIKLVALEQKALQRAVLDSANVGFFMADISGARVFVNLRLAEMLGCQRADLLGNGWISFVAEDQREKVSREWADCVRFRREFKMPFDYITRDGRRLSVECNAREVRDGDQFFGWAGRCETTGK